MRIEDIDDFMYLERSDFEAVFEMGITDSTGATIPTNQSLSRVLVGKMIRAQKWYDQQPIRDYDTWSELTTKTLNEFRGTNKPNTPTTPPTSGAISMGNFYSPTPTVTTPEPTKPDASVTTFIRSIKRSIDDYPSFSEAKNWYNWQRKFKTKAAAHGCEKLLDRSYVPDASSEPLFIEQKKFLYDVLAEKVVTQRGKHIVRLYEPTLDAQKVWAALCEEYRLGRTRPYLGS
jgi:hypothetical protein